MLLGGVMLRKNLLVLFLIFLSNILYGGDNLKYDNEILTDMGIRKIGLIEEVILSDSFINKLTDEEKKELKKIKKLRIKYETDKNTITFCNNHKEFRGLIPDILNAFNRKCKIDIENIKYSLFSKKFKDLMKNNEIDMIISSTENNIYLKNFIKKDVKICLDKKDKIKLRFFIKKDKIAFFNILIKFKDTLSEENQIIEYLQLKNIEKDNGIEYSISENKYVFIALLIFLILFKKSLDLKKNYQTEIGNKKSLDTYINNELKDKEEIILINIKGLVNSKILISMKLILRYVFNKKNIYKIGENQFCILGKINDLDEKIKKLEKKIIFLIKNKNIKIIVGFTTYRKKLNIYSYFNYMDRKLKKDIENINFKYKLKKVEYEDIIEYENYKKEQSIFNKVIFDIKFKYFLVKNSKTKDIENILIDFFIPEKKSIYLKNKNYKENLDYKLIENAIYFNKKILNGENTKKSIGIIVMISTNVFSRDDFLEELLKILKNFNRNDINLILGLNYNNFIGKENKNKIIELKKMGIKFLLNNIDINKINLLNLKVVDYLFINYELLNNKLSDKIGNIDIILEESIENKIDLLEENIKLFKSKNFLFENEVLKELVKIKSIKI